MVEEARPPQPEGPPPTAPPRGGSHWSALLFVCTLGLSALIDLLVRGLSGHAHPAATPAAPGLEAAPVHHSDEEEIRHPDGRIEHPSVRSEKSDASFGWILGIIIGAMGFAAFVHWIILYFFFDYNRYESKIHQSPYPLAPRASRALEKEGLPPNPRLEQLDRTGPPMRYPEDERGAMGKGERSADTYLRQQAREKVLGSYGPTDEKGIVHIPIDRAMKHLAGKLPSRKEPKARAGAQPHDSGLVDGGESNSGRMFRRQARWSDR